MSGVSGAYYQSSVSELLFTKVLSPIIRSKESNLSKIELLETKINLDVKHFKHKIRLKFE